MGVLGEAQIRQFTLPYILAPLLMMNYINLWMVLFNTGQATGD